MIRLFTVISFLSFFYTQGQFDNKQWDIIDILRYDFNIKINDTTDFIEGETLISLRRKKLVKQVYLNLMNQNNSGYGMQVLSVTDNHQHKLKFNHLHDSLDIFFSEKTPQDTLRIRVVYHGKPADGLYIRHNKYGKRTFFGDNWPNRAQYWLPVIDHPSDKAIVSWTVTAPKHYDVVASGRLMKKVNVGEDFLYHYQTKVPIPTKVMVFAAADFSIKYFDNLSLHQNCVPVSSWIYANSPVSGFDDYKCSISALQFYDSLIGPYVYQKLANVQSKTRFGGMENAGNIFYDENTVDGTKSSESLVAHEVAHQWFGNTVTEKKWRDIWLSEGFATYLTDLYLKHRYGKQRFMERMKMERQKVIRYNFIKRQPVVYNENKNLFNLLNRNSYEKGAWVLYMLHQKIGNEKFTRLLRKFYQTYRLKNASTEDFIEMAEKISGENLKAFFDQWLYRSGVPVLKVTSEIDTKKSRLQIHIIQKGEIYRLTLPIRIKWQGGQTDFVLKINNAEHTEVLRLPKSFDANDYQLILDPDVQVLFKTNIF